MSVGLIIFFVSWLLIGFISAVLILANDVRGESYENTKKYIKQEGFLLLTAMGYISLVISIIIILNDKELFSKAMYKIINIGLKKKTK